MRPTLLLSVLALLGGVSSGVRAQGVVSTSWDACTGPINKVSPVGASVELYVSVIGQSQVHQAYGFQLLIGGSHPFPDSWRFDVTGCQTAALITIDHRAPQSVAAACPSFQGNLPSFQVKDYSYDALTGRARATMYNAYPDNAGGTGAPRGNPAATNPLQRYFLARFVFDETYGVSGPGDPPNTCGGLEKGLCFHLNEPAWLDLAGNEIPWATDPGQAYVTVNGPVSFSVTDFRGYTIWTCDPPVPTRPVTWGSLKNQYR